MLQHLDLAVAARAVAEQAQLVGELAGQVIPYEAEVVVLLHDGARRGQAILLDDLLPHRKPQVVGVDAERDLGFGGDGPHHVRVTLDGVQVSLLRYEIRLAQQPRMP